MGAARAGFRAVSGRLEFGFRFWVLVENKGSNWVRFVILFWVRH
jgi:hypothetical protein